MNIPIRMIGIATTVFWAFLIVFCVLGIYSMKDIQFELGEPQTSIAADELLFRIPISIVNRGYYGLSDFNVSTEIFDSDGMTITRACTFIHTIGAGASVNATHELRLNITETLNNHQNLLFNDTELRAEEIFGVRAAQLIPVRAEMNFSLPWGAPLYNFALGTPELSPYNSSHLRVVVPISFENHAPFDILGTIRVQIHNDEDVHVGEGQTFVDAHQNSAYAGSIESYVSITETTLSGHFEVCFETPLFSYGPLVISYGS